MGELEDGKSFAMRVHFTVLRSVRLPVAAFGFIGHAESPVHGHDFYGKTFAMHVIISMITFWSAGSSRCWWIFLVVDVGDLKKMKFFLVDSEFLII